MISCQAIGLTPSPPSELEEGRRIYRAGEVRELELSGRDAIVHRRIEKKDEYAVIEWSATGTLSVRSSSTDRKLAQALAVAGLHEIEELVADEISPLPGDLEATNGNGHAPDNGTDGHGQGEAPAPASRLAGGQSRPLVLVFKIKAAGLSFQAFWLNADRKTRLPALGPDAHANGNGHVSSAERAKLIGLAAYARKTHFRYDQDTGAYLLESLVEIPNFLRATLPTWRRIFTVELDERAAHLMKGTRAVEIEAVAERPSGGRTGSASADGLNLRWIFRAGERMLTDHEVSVLLKRGGQPVILPNLGIVSLPSERWDSYCAWQKSIAENPDGAPLPPYLIFSLFNDARVKLTLSPEIEAWRRGYSLRRRPRPPVGLASTLPAPRRGMAVSPLRGRMPRASRRRDGPGKDPAGPLAPGRPSGDGPPEPDRLPGERRAGLAGGDRQVFPQSCLDVLKAGHDFTSRPDPVLWLASYTQLRKHRAMLDGVDFGYAVLDEGQFIKNPDAKVTQTCFAIRARHRIVLTGTPLENRQLDLWSIFRFLFPGLLGSRASFEAALSDDREGTLARLRAQLAPFILRRTKREVAQELPPKVEMDLICPLTDVQRSEYARICAEGLARLGDDVGAAMREKSFGFLALLTRLRQTCCDPDMLPWLHAPLSDSGKINLLMEKLAEIVGSGHKVVIFSQFVLLLNRVRAALAQQFPSFPATSSPA